MDWETKAQNFLVVTIIAAIFCFIIGVIMGPKSEDDMAKGHEAMNTSRFAENWGPDYRFSEGRYQDFFSVFAIFFPSVTGIQAGANISGDLKNPASAIPKGTLLALLISAISYISFVLFAGFSAMRDASGDIADLANGTLADCAADFVSYIIGIFMHNLNSNTSLYLSLCHLSPANSDCTMITPLCNCSVLGGL